MKFHSIISWKKFWREIKIWNTEREFSDLKKKKQKNVLTLSAFYINKRNQKKKKKKLSVNFNIIDGFEFLSKNIGWIVWYYHDLHLVYKIWLMSDWWFKNYIWIVIGQLRRKRDTIIRAPYFVDIQTLFYIFNNIVFIYWPWYQFIYHFWCNFKNQFLLYFHLFI